MDESSDGRFHVRTWPDLQLVTIPSLVKSSQQSGSSSTILLKTGGNIAVLALGSTGCGSTFCFGVVGAGVSSAGASPELDRFESDRTRLLAVVFCVSARWRDAKRDEKEDPRCLTDACISSKG